MGPDKGVGQGDRPPKNSADAAIDRTGDINDHDAMSSSNVSRSGAPVFIIGYGRSGTTLLWNILSKSPDLHLQMENNLLYALSLAGADFTREQTTVALVEQRRKK